MQTCMLYVYTSFSPYINIHRINILKYYAIDCTILCKRINVMHTQICVDRQISKQNERILTYSKARGLTCLQIEFKLQQEQTKCPLSGRQWRDLLGPHGAELWSQVSNHLMIWWECEWEPCSSSLHAPYCQPLLSLVTQSYGLTVWLAC